LTSNLRIIPLGGLGQIGKNMMALEYDNDIVVIDCGVQFPSEDMLGVDLIIPDISYLLENSDRVRAILITHGHEDHIGALPFVLPRLNVPVYAPKLAHGLISARLREHRGARNSRTESIEPGVPYQFGKHFRVTWFRVCHSIPDAMGLAIDTPLGTVIHTGDFKIDHTPVDGRTLDLAYLAKHGSEGVLLLCSDSTYAEIPGYTDSEQSVGAALDRAISEAPGRVMVATFASLISRIQQIVQAANRHGRKVSIVGRSMVNNVSMAASMGYLTLPPGILIPLAESRQLPPEEIVLITTGSQGEPTSALVRIANQDHRDIRVIKGDTIIISATPIPGNELHVSRTIDNLLRQGAKVLYDKNALVHVHGHASQEELKMMLSLLRPKYFVPVHGEFRHLVAHARLAENMGVDKSNVFVMEDGDLLELSKNGGKMEGTIPAGPIYIDGLETRDSKSPVLRDRRALSKDGVVVVILPISKETGQPERDPEIVTSGFIDQSETPKLFKELAERLGQLVSENHDLTQQQEMMKAKVKEHAREFLYQSTHRRPMIVTLVLEL
jgi:ribonuclease J